ncbi:hypothetical protein [Lentzea sp. HUAS12]|uniref:hypothetical protein n=1 Tax=Lentzea sp. HUAS12 TaxID=2951806 RepID=UPI0020A219E5|nr:hypothetical protein [Lentzea sp. HUAS12]USX52392.1 hypothetical protein ND450_44985 [Lentzea sp. HUAS12]
MRCLVAALVPAIGTAVVLLWSGMSGRPFPDLLRRVCDKATPRVVAALPTNRLAVVGAGSAALALFGFFRELLAPAGDPIDGGATGALVFLATLAFICAYSIARRRRVR